MLAVGINNSISMSLHPLLADLQGTLKTLAQESKMEPIFLTVTTGIIATAVMVTLLYALVWRGIHHGDLLRFVGVIVFPKSRNPEVIGVVLHVIIGIGLSWSYHYILGKVYFSWFVLNAGFGAFLGFIQGIIVSALFAEKLPIRERTPLLRRFYLPASYAYGAAHQVYGISQGLLIASYFSASYQGLAGAGGVLMAMVGGYWLLGPKR